MSTLSSMYRSIVDFSITSTGTTVALKPHAFIVSQNETIVETLVDHVHVEPCTAISCCSISSSIEDSDELPNVFVSSSGMVSSWKPFHDGLRSQYTCISQVYKCASGLSPSISDISPCNSALAVVSGRAVEIIVVANNLGLSHFTTFDHELAVKSISIVSKEKKPYILVSACGSGVVLWDILSQTSLYKSSATMMTSPEGNDALVSARYSITNGGGYIGHYHRNEFHLLSFKPRVQEDTNPLNKNQNSGSHLLVVDKVAVVQLTDINGSKCLALDFVNDNERLCILVSVSQVLIIDSLQRCIVKNISVGTLLNVEAETIDQLCCSMAFIQFPHVGLYSKQLALLVRHQLDAVFALAGSLELAETSNQNTRTTYKPLVMSDEASVEQFNAQFSGTKRNQCKSIGSNIVKSSGYCKIEETKREAKRKASKEKMNRKNKEERQTNSFYPIDCSILDSHQNQHDDAENPCLLPPLATVSFDGFGEYLAASSVDKSLHVFRLPMSKHGAASKQILQSYPSAESGRKSPSPPSSCRPSWSKSRARKMIAYDHKVYSLSSSMKSMHVLCDLGEKATNACFCAKDKIIVHTLRCNLSLMRFPLDSLPSKENQHFTGEDIRSMSGTIHHNFSFEPAQRITSVAAVNGVETNIIAVTCSDKSLHVIDINGKELWSQSHAAGERAAHSIAFPRVTDNIPLSPDSFNLLVAASTDEGGLLNLWDLRCGEMVKSFQGHANRKDHCMASFSPCMRYIGVGGEGNCGSATLFDIRGRNNNPIQTNLGRRDRDGNLPFRDDSILDVQFHPLYPQLVTASLSGRLRWYTES